MQFLTLYTPAVPPSGPPDAEHIAKMGKLIEDMSKAGVLVTTGPIMSRNTGMKVTRRNGSVAVEDGPVARAVPSGIAGNSGSGENRAISELRARHEIDIRKDRGPR